MEKIADFFKDLKERLSNPLISSFLIAWLIFNWKIIIGLCFYKITELKGDGYNSYIDLILKNSDFENSFVKPFLSAIAYTFIFPFIKNIILAFGSWIKRWGEDWNLKISRKGYISVTKYIKLREQYSELINKLVEIANSESQFQDDNAALKLENAELLSKVTSLKGEVEKWADYNSVKNIVGTWDLTVRLIKKKQGEAAVEEISTYHIEINNMSIHLRNNVSNEMVGFSIENVVSNFRILALYLIQESSNGIKATWTFNLDYSFDELNGVDDGGSILKLKRKRRLQ